MCVRACVCVLCERACVHMVHWFVQSIFNRNIVGSILTGYGHTHLFSISTSAWLPTGRCIYLIMWCGRNGKKEKGIVAGQK